ncbi:MAG: polyamine aminopropyltransferase [Halothiobacillaceae bacterium]|nr:polyamine aminopropyltransferase [Halothiobacillaceae bacterium]
MTRPTTSLPTTQNSAWISETIPHMGAAFSLKTTQKLDEIQSPFQNIAIYATEHWGNLMVIDEAFMLTSLENFVYHEMLSHPALFTHLNPKDVVIIGGGDCGTLSEVLKHPGVENVTQIDIDEQVTRMAEKWFPELCQRNSDPRADLRFDDGIKFMREAPDASVDIIIVDSTDPVGPGEGLFDGTFIADCYRVLREGGILVSQSESPFYHMDILQNVHRAMLATGFSDRRALLFPQPVYPGGSITCTLARKGATLDTFRSDDARNKSFTTRYYNVGIHQGALTPPEFVREALENIQSS